MPWARLDDGFYDHPKVIALLEEEPEGWAAIGFWTACLAWAHRHTRKPGKTPGHLPHHAVVRMDRIRGAAFAGLLVKAGLWQLHPDGDGWLIHDFSEYLPSAKLSAARAAAGSKGGQAKAANRSYELENPSYELADPSSAPSKSLANAGLGIGIGSSSTEGSTPVAVREDVRDLCSLLADRIEANGSKRPAITKGWHDACRLLLDKDGRSPAQVHRAIEWCQQDEFWRANILSMPKLREKYDQLRLAALRNGQVEGKVPTTNVGTATQRVQQVMEAGKRVREMLDRKELE